MRFILLFCLLIFFAACKQQQAATPVVSPAGYDFRQIYALKLPVELDEISGLCYLPRDSSLLAVGDEIGNVYKINVRRPTYIQRWRFAGPGDYEGLEIAGAHLYVLRSDGALYQVNFADKDTTYVNIYPFPTKGNEFESLCYDAARNRLMIICKECAVDDKHTFSAYFFNLGNMQWEQDTQAFRTENIDRLHNYKGKKFKPSGAAFHPITGDLYVVSAINRVLVVFDHNFQPKEAIPLVASDFIQPEGISFDSAGNMFISNETNKVSASSILIFPYRPTTKR